MFTLLTFAAGVGSHWLYQRLKKEIHTYLQNKEKQLKDVLTENK